ncbi:hypothetical protein Micbo1qcDRAFT_160100, partial [Microdochium bolleyi]
MWWFTEGGQSRLPEQQAMLVEMGIEWKRNVEQRICNEQDDTRRLLLRVTQFFAIALLLFLAHALDPPDASFEDIADDCLDALKVAEQILDQSEHESSLLLFNDKILPSIPNLLVRCPVPRVRAQGLQLMARAFSMMAGESKRNGSAPPRNLWLSWWWANMQAENSENPDYPDLELMAGVPLIKPSLSGSPDSDRDSCDSADEAYIRLAGQVCMRAPQLPEDEGRTESLPAAL